MIYKAKLKKEFLKQKDGYLFILPQMLLFLVFMVYPVFEGLRLSFYNVGFVTKTFVGFRNYIELFKDSIFIKAVLNNLQFVLIVTTLSVVFGLFISTAVFDKTSKYMSFIRGCYYLPVMITMVAFSITWLWMVNPAMGLVSHVLNSIGIQNVNIMGNSTVALYILIVVMWLFNLGEAVILYLAAIIGIPQEQFEAAEIDGASRFMVIRFIIIPLVSPTTFYFVILCFIDVIKVFLAVHLMTAGGPNYATTTMMYLCYQEAFVMNNMGKASAIGMMMFVIVSLLSIIAMTRLKAKN
ncbi:MAG TPA: sugar ABC transporter permease [Ruminiclostridium sp.]